MTVVTYLEGASMALRSAEQHALVRGDPDLGERLEALACRVETETMYARGVERLALPSVARRDLGPRATLGQLLQDPAMRALREARGISNPPLRSPAIKADAA